MARAQIGRTRQLLEMAAKADLKATLYQNGITKEDVTRESDKAFREGFEEGYAAATTTILRTVYAAICIALSERGMDTEAVKETLQRVDDRYCTAITHEEMLDEAFEKAGIIIDFNDPIERIR